MMKNAIKIILVMLFVFMLTSCNLVKNSYFNTDSIQGSTQPNKSLSINNDVKSKMNTTDKSNQQDNNTNNSNSTHNIQCEIVKISYTDGKGIIITYPQVTNLYDTEKQKKINEIIKNDALKVLNLYKEADNEVTLNVNYIIKLNTPNLLSIQYLGLGYVKGGAYPNNLFHTTNIDVNKQSKLNLSDVVNIGNNFIEKLRKSKYKTYSSDLNLETLGVINNVFDKFNEDDLIKKLVKADEIGEENTEYLFSYLTNDSLGISIGVSHALGDHAEFEIRYEDIKENMKTENEIWKNLLELPLEGSNKK